MQKKTTVLIVTAIIVGLISCTEANQDRISNIPKYQNLAELIEGIKPSKFEFDGSALIRDKADMYAKSWKKDSQLIEMSTLAYIVYVPSTDDRAMRLPLISAFIYKSKGNLLVLLIGKASVLRARVIMDPKREWLNLQPIPKSDLQADLPAPPRCGLVRRVLVESKDQTVCFESKWAMQDSKITPDPLLEKLTKKKNDFTDYFARRVNKQGFEKLLAQFYGLPELKSLPVNKEIIWANGTTIDGNVVTESEVVRSMSTGKLEMIYDLEKAKFIINEESKDSDIVYGRLEVRPISGWVQLVFLKHGDVQWHNPSLSPILRSPRETSIDDILLGNSVTLNETEIELGFTALMVCARDGRTEMVKYLLENGAQVNVKSLNGLNVMSFAVHGRHKNIVKLLLENGAETNEEIQQLYPDLYRTKQPIVPEY